MQDCCALKLNAPVYNSARAGVKIASVKHSLSKHVGWLAGLLAITLVLLATWKLTLGNRIIARGDLLLYFYPLRDYASAAIRSLHLPLWEPYTFMGAPFLANSQVGFFYPFNILTAWTPVAHAVAWNIALHMAIAAAGMYLLARRNLCFSVFASLCAAISFGLGGYLGAQIEHLNQLQVLAWLPLQVALVLPAPEARPRFWRKVALLSLIIALQVLAGHTQSLYICLVAVAIAIGGAFVAHIITLWRANHRQPFQGSSASISAILRSVAIPLCLLLIAGGLAALMSAVQLAPTLELASLSARSGGLTFYEVGSFSWRPWVIARALLPTYGDPLFAEYVAYLGVGGLALALLGALGIFAPSPDSSQTDTRKEQALLAILLIVIGGLLALGIATPLFRVLYKLAPGFNLFRAQARWLIVFALGSAVAIGLGVQALQDGLALRQKHVWLASWIALSVILVSGLFLGARFSPEAEYRTLPATSVLIGWGASYALISALILGIQFQWPLARYAAPLFGALLCAELLVASQFQPYARASDEQALTDLRPATADLLAGQQLSGTPQGTNTSQRVLALSGLFFDPGDLQEQKLIYGSQLSADELYDRIIATKQKEVLSPNLSLYYRLPSVDGYDGGLLPLRTYSSFVQQFLPATNDSDTKPGATDGRLRELLPSVPADEWLDRMAVKYVIADKTHDVFIDNVYYDLLFPQSLSQTVHLSLDAFSSTALGIVLSAPGHQTGDLLLRATITDTAGIIGTYDITATQAFTNAYFGLTLPWEGRRIPSQVIFSPVVSNVTLLGMTSVDAAAGAFQSQPIRGQYDMRLVHSGDVKIYENMRPAPRAFISSLADCSTVDGQLQVNVVDNGAIQAASTVSITQDEPEQMTLRVKSQVPGWLVVRDAYYPGWVARVDGALTPISQADGMFRAVQVLPGEHTVVFSYEPASVRLGAAISGVGLAAWLGLAALGLRRR
jgi:hypothetical protein